jgi:hypothetical protein
METPTMGRVTTEALIENASELYMADRGLITDDQVHRLRVTDAPVDTGATYISMPKALIGQLNLHMPIVLKAIRTTFGREDLPLYGPVRLTIQGRVFHGDVVEIADHCPVLIGQLPLEGLDLVVDTKVQRLIGNPAHDGINTAEAY